MSKVLLRIDLKVKIRYLCVVMDFLKNDTVKIQIFILNMLCGVPVHTLSKMYPINSGKYL
jgi:hypothetical protein